MKLRGKMLIGLILVAIATAIYLLVVRPNESKRAVEAYKQQLRAQGEKLGIAELAPVPPKGSLDDALAFVNAAGAVHQPANDAPAMKFIVPGRALVAWQQEVLPSTADKVSNIWTGLSLELRANHNALTNLQAIVASSPVLYFNLDYSKGFGILLPHLAKLKQAEILASDAAVVALHDGQYAEAWTNLQTATTLVRIYRPEPLIISHLVQIASAHIALRVTWEFLQSEQWTDAQLAGLQSQWEAMEFFNASEQAFLMERAMSIDFFSMARKSRDLTTAMGMPGSSGGAGSQGFLDSLTESIKPVFDRIRYAIWKHSWSYDEELYYLQNHAAGLDAIRRTRSSGAAAPALNELKLRLAGINQLHTNMLTHFMAGLGSDWISNALHKFAEAETARRMLVTAIALKRYHLRHGNYPADLNAMVPEFLRKVPQDLMDGKPLRYRPMPDGNYLLYSVGDDGKDDNGDPTPTDPSNQSRNWLKGRDIVWPQPATAEEVAAYYKTQAKPAASPSGTNATGR